MPIFESNLSKVQQAIIPKLLIWLYLAVAGMVTGSLYADGVVKPDQLGNFLRWSLGTQGPGSLGLTPLLSPFFSPLP